MQLNNLATMQTKRNHRETRSNQDTQQSESNCSDNKAGVFIVSTQTHKVVGSLQANQLAYYSVARELSRCALLTFVIVI